MKDCSYTLDTIRKKKLITEYLSSKGIYPVRESGNKLMYLCPLHTDTAPSFTVYLPHTSDGHQQYYCFGCKSCKCIIQLYSKLEDVSWRHAVARLGEDLNITSSDAIDFLVSSLKKEMESDEVENLSDELGSLSLNISILGFDYLKNSRYDKEEFKFLEALYKYIDKIIIDGDIHKLQHVYEFVSERTIEYNKTKFTPFGFRRVKWDEKKTVEILECENAYDNIK